MLIIFNVIKFVKNSKAVNIMTLGSILSRARLAKDLTLRDVEDELGISNSYLSQLENDKIGCPSAVILYKLCRHYEISFDDVMVRAGFVEAVVKYEDSPLLSISVTEESELLGFLNYMRWRDKRGDDVDKYL